MVGGLGRESDISLHTGISDSFVNVGDNVEKMGDKNVKGKREGKSSSVQPFHVSITESSLQKNRQTRCYAGFLCKCLQWCVCFYLLVQSSR